MKKILFILFAVIIYQDSIFSQNFVSKKGGPFQYQSLLTEQQKDEVLVNLKKNKDFYLEQTNREYYICKNGEVYAILCKYSKYGGPAVGSKKEIVPLFEILCKEEREELFGVNLFFKDIDLEYKQRLRVEY